jgi:hypothetical protein
MTDTPQPPSSTPLPSDTPTTAPTSSFTPVATATAATPTAIATRTPTVTATPAVYRVLAESLPLYEGPGEEHGELAQQAKRGDLLTLTGRTRDGQWWRIDWFGREAWMPAQTWSGADRLPIVTPPATPTRTPTASSTPTRPLPTAIPLVNAGFANIEPNYLPGWQWQPYDNHDQGGDYVTPLIKQADDSQRTITGPTLQIDAAGHLKFRVFVYQRVEVPPQAMLRSLTRTMGASM